jgi:conjugal transfer ATP-binding protein TraC
VNDFLNRPTACGDDYQLIDSNPAATIADIGRPRAKTFKLSDEEKYLLLESDVGEGIFFAGLKHVAIKVIASYTEDQIITSDPSQILAIGRSRCCFHFAKCSA